MPGFRHCKTWLRAKIGTTHMHPSSVTPCHSTIHSFIYQSHFQLSIHPFIHPSNCLFIHSSIHPSMLPIVHPFISPCVYNIYMYLIICISSIFHCKSIDNNSLSIHNSFREYVLSNSLRIPYLRFFCISKKHPWMKNLVLAQVLFLVTNGSLTSLVGKCHELKQHETYGWDPQVQ